MAATPQPLENWLQWDTSDHDWLEGRGDEMLLINMIDDATSQWFARFVPSDSTVEKHECAGAVHEEARSATGGLHGSGALFKTAQKNQTGRGRRSWRTVDLPPTQLGRALQELGIVWIPAYSPQGQGPRGTGIWDCAGPAGEGMRVADVKTLEQAIITRKLSFCLDQRDACSRTSQCG